MYHNSNDEIFFRTKLYLQWPWHFRFTNPSSTSAHPAFWSISNAPIWFAIAPAAAAITTTVFYGPRLLMCLLVSQFRWLISKNLWEFQKSRLTISHIRWFKEMKKNRKLNYSWFVWSRATLQSVPSRIQSSHLADAILMSSFRKLTIQ